MLPASKGKRMPNVFTQHPHAVGESYTTHAAHAARFGVTLILAGAACLVHALLPFLFAHTASRCVRDLHASMTQRTARAARQACENSTQRPLAG
jgi:hypothetical protein